MNSGQLERAITTLEAGVEAGLHLGVQIYVSQRGEVVADLAIGESRQGEPMRSESLLLWFSATKPVIAVAVAQQWERGRFDLDDRVSAHLPEFGLPSVFCFFSVLPEE